MDRRAFLRWLAAGGAGVVGLGAHGLASPYHHVVTRREVGVRGLRAPLRVAVMADMHLGVYSPENLRAWVESVNREAPDLVVLPGDLTQVARREASLAGRLRELLAPLGGLRAPLGAFAVLGNHDYQAVWQGGREGFTAALGSVGVRLLVNQGVGLRDDLFLAGADDLWHGEPDARAAVAGAQARQAVVLLAHNPDLLPTLPARVDLTLCGHTHGGQVVLPLLGPPVVPSRYGARFAGGLYQ
ncbi:MAG TPA: metallophosphoesterase, partial [Deinococcales bacterium]|nr:metallophosphoesterase [Deinococcales bacterium]